MTLQRHTRALLQNRRLRHFNDAYENSTAFVSAMSCNQGDELDERQQRMIGKDLVLKEKYKLFLKSERNRRNKIAQGMKNEKGILV